MRYYWLPVVMLVGCSTVPHLPTAEQVNLQFSLPDNMISKLQIYDVPPSTEIIAEKMMTEEMMTEEMMTEESVTTTPLLQSVEVTVEETFATDGKVAKRITKTVITKPVITKPVITKPVITKPIEPTALVEPFPISPIAVEKIVAPANNFVELLKVIAGLLTAGYAVVAAVKKFATAKNKSSHKERGLGFL